jgi:hypothetical protein
MATETHDEREVRATRNQALFRLLNEKLTGLNEAFESVTESFTISCECADAGCVEMIDIGPDEYHAIRAEPRHFAVRPGHVYPEVEGVIREAELYVVVEKNASSDAAAEVLAQEPATR